MREKEKPSADRKLKQKKNKSKEKKLAKAKSLQKWHNLYQTTESLCGNQTPRTYSTPCFQPNTL